MNIASAVIYAASAVIEHFEGRQSGGATVK